MSDQEPDKLEGVYAKLLRLFKEGEQSERQELREWLGILESGLRRDLLNRLVQTQEFLARLAYLERRDQQGQLLRIEWPEQPEHEVQQARQERLAILELVEQPELLDNIVKYLQESVAQIQQPSSLESAAPISL